MRTTVGLIAGALWLTIVIAALIYGERIKRFRNDIDQTDSAYSGQSRWLEGNILRTANYDETGKRKVAVLRALYAAQVAPALVLLYLFMTGT